MPAPQDWPLLEYAVCWSAGPSQSPVQDYWCDLSGRTEGTTTVRRGKQYELDQVQPGEMTLTFRNDDGVFDPTNTGSPFYPQVKPYRLIRLRAQYPATVNLLTADQATAFYASKGSYTGSSLPQWVHPGAGSTVTIIPYVTGSNLYAAGAAGQSVVFTGFAVQPGLTYTASCVAGVNTPTYTLTWYDVNGAVISSVSAHSVTVQNVTGTAPANAVGASFTVSDSAVAVTVGKVQVEQNSTASTWVQPGTWYSLFTGYVERWPQSWSSGGNYGTVAVDCVDLFAFLANAPLNYPAYLEVISLGPNWFYSLDESAGASAFTDKAAQTKIAATLIGSSASSGNTLANTGGYLPLGIPGPVVTINNISSSVAGQVQLNNGGPPVSTAWTRIYAWNPGSTVPTGTPAFLWIGTPLTSQLEAYVNGPTYELFEDTGQLQLGILNPAGTLAVSSGPVGYVADGGWHLIAVTMSSDGRTVAVYFDGTLAFTTTVASDTRLNCSTGFDVIGGIVGGDVIPSSISTSCAFAAELPYAATATQMNNLYEAFRYAWEGTPAHIETSGDRYARILGWIGYTGPSAVDTGSETDYGPATDITGGSNPTYALQALQNVVTTEYGQHYIAADGTVTFKARTARYNPAPAVSFGEQAGEVPYLNASMDFDPTRVGNQIEVDAQYGNAAYFATDADSINDYGQVGIQQTVNSLDPESLQDGAEYLLYQNKQPLQRLAALPVDVGSNPSVFASLLGLDLGTAVTVNRRPSAAPVISQVGYLEQIQWTIGSDRSCQWSAQVSNALAHYFGALDSTAYGRFGADSNTLNAAITSTATSLAIATAAGKAVFSNSASDYPMNILMDAEQITLTAAPGGSTSPQTFTVTRGVNGTTPASHSAGAAVSVVGSLVFGF